MVKAPISIGNYDRGVSRTLSIKLKASDDLKVGPRKSEVFFNWLFVAVRGAEGPGPELPQIPGPEGPGDPGPDGPKPPGPDDPKGPGKPTYPVTVVNDDGNGNGGNSSWGKDGGPFGSPKTGDAFPLVVIAASLALSACGILLAAVKIRRARGAAVKGRRDE
jgi:hypothetical protein